MSRTKETWKPVPTGTPVKYWISNHGRLAVKQDDGTLDIRKFKPTAGIYRYNYRDAGKNKTLFIAKEVATAFVKKPSARHTHIIHKDHDYLNNHVSNLAWATRDEHRLHTASSPRWKQARDRRTIVKSVHAQVLSEKDVLALKKLIWDPERKLSLSRIAEKFNVSEMQIYRIKRGLFWYHIRVPNEPVHPLYKKNIRNIELLEKEVQVSHKLSKKRPAKGRGKLTARREKELLALKKSKRETKLAARNAVRQAVRNAANPSHLPVPPKKKRGSKKAGKKQGFPIRRRVE